MARALAKLQAENASLKADSVTKPDQAKAPEGKPSSKADTHPALAGLEPDADGDYLVDGAYYTRDEIIAKYESTHGLAELRERLDRMEQAAADEKRTAQLQAEAAKLHQDIASNVSRLRAELFPEVPAEKAGTFDNRLIRNVYALVEEKTSGGAELSEDVLLSAVTETFAEERELMGILGAAQVADNTKSKTQHPVAPGGIPGAETPTDPLSLPQRLAEKMADKAARLAESMRK